MCSALSAFLIILTYTEENWPISSFYQFKTSSSYGNSHSVYIVRELDVPGEIYERKTFQFEFSTVEMPYETYNGVNVRLRLVTHLLNSSM